MAKKKPTPAEKQLQEKRKQLAGILSRIDEGLEAAKPQTAPTSPTATPGRSVPTLEAVAVEFGVSRRTAHEWKAAGALGHAPVRSAGRGSLVHQPARTAAGPTTSKTPNAARRWPTPKSPNERQRERLANDREAGLLYERDEVDRSCRELILHIKAHLEEFPDSVRTQFGSDVADELEATLRLLLRQLATWKPIEQETPHAAPSPHRKRRDVNRPASRNAAQAPATYTRPELPADADLSHITPDLHPSRSPSPTWSRIPKMPAGTTMPT